MLLTQKKNLIQNFLALGGDDLWLCNLIIQMKKFFRMTYDIDEVGFCHVKSPMILFVVLSQVKDEERRKVVRETW